MNRWRLKESIIAKPGGGGGVCMERHFLNQETKNEQMPFYRVQGTGDYI